MHGYEHINQKVEGSTSHERTGIGRTEDHTSSSLSKKLNDKGKRSVRFEAGEITGSSASNLKNTDFVRGRVETHRGRGEPQLDDTDDYKKHIDHLVNLGIQGAVLPFSKEMLDQFPRSVKTVLAPRPGSERTPGSGLLRSMGKKQIRESLASTQATDPPRTPQQYYMKEVRSRRNSRIARELGIEEPARMQGPPALDFHETAEQLRPVRPSAQKVRELNYGREPSVIQKPETPKASFAHLMARRAREVTFGPSSGDQAKYTRVSSRESDIPLGNLPSRQSSYEAVQDPMIAYPQKALTRASRQSDTPGQPSSSNTTDARGGMGQDKWWEIRI